MTAETEPYPTPTPLPPSSQPYIVALHRSAQVLEDKGENGKWYLVPQLFQPGVPQLILGVFIECVAVHHLGVLSPIQSVPGQND